MNTRLTSLCDQLREMAILGGVSSLLSWDQETYMPKGSIGARSDQQSLVARLIHERHTSDGFKSDLSQFVDLETGGFISNGWSSDEVALLKEVYKDWKKAISLPASFVETYTKLLSESHHIWQEARTANDFSLFAPTLDRVIQMTKEKTQYLGGDNAYDTLLDEYEPGMTVSELTPLFSDLRTALVDLLQRVQGSSKRFVDLTTGTYDVDKQWQFGLDVLGQMGYDFETGRQDRSTHPFTTQFHPTDVRITTRLDPHHIMEGFSSTVHEGGHALYEQGLASEWFGTPLSSAISLGIHESQSRLWEHYVCNSEGFWRGQYPKLQAVFPEALSAVSMTDFYESINQVKPGFIRVEADELTYNLHIMVRYELEQAIFNGDVKTADLPALWTQKYQEYLGVTPPDMAQGILQDVHWSGGHFGYFPTYTLGNLYGRMLFDTALQKISQLGSDIEKGELLGLRDWLKTHVHQVGMRFSATELMGQITGETLSIQPFMSYLTKKYSQIYSL